jgi:hypothetical protein
VPQHLADHRHDGVVGGGRSDGLQVAAGAEGAAFALDHQHLDVVRPFDIGAELCELFRNRQVDRVERCGAIERDGGDSAVDAKQCGIVG